MDKITLEGFEANEELYQKMSKPFTTKKEAEKAINNYHKAIRRLREKYRIADTVTLSAVNVDEGGDGIYTLSNSVSNGNATITLWLLNWGQGKLQEQFLKELVETEQALKGAQMVIKSLSK